MSKKSVGFVDYTKGIIRLGLHFITSYANERPDDDKIKQYRKSVTSTMNTFCHEIAKSHRKADFIPSYAAAWLIPDSVIHAEEEEITYPGIMLIAKVFRDIKHKNHV